MSSYNVVLCDWLLSLGIIFSIHVVTLAVRHAFVGLDSISGYGRAILCLSIPLLMAAWLPSVSGLL